MNNTVKLLHIVAVASIEFSTLPLQIKIKIQNVSVECFFLSLDQVFDLETY